jgi:hypothetical protein
VRGIFQKRSHLSIRAHNETLSVIAMRVRNPDDSPVTIDGRNAAPALSCFAVVAMCVSIPERVLLGIKG